MDQRKLLLIEVHKAIEESATRFAEALISGKPFGLIYPPNGGLNEQERKAIIQLPKDAITQSALRKVIADAASAPIFHLFALVDGVADPEGYGQAWLGFRMSPASLEEKPEPRPFWHDDFFETYWDWRAKRPDLGWMLDDFDDTQHSGE